MARYFIGIDVSTTASKALAIDETGQVIAVKSYSHDLSTPRPLWSEQDPENWWAATSSALRDLLKEISPDDVAAVGLTGQMHGLTSLNADGKPLRPAILWNDQRSVAQCADHRDRRRAKAVQADWQYSAAWVHRAEDSLAEAE
jgi:xylulokinase